MNTQYQNGNVACKRRHRVFRATTVPSAADCFAYQTDGAFDNTPPPVQTGRGNGMPSGRWQGDNEENVPCPEHRIALADPTSLRQTLQEKMGFGWHAHVDYDVVLRFIRNHQAIMSAKMLLPEKPRIWLDTQFHRRLQKAKGWEIVYVAKADVTLAQSPMDRRTWEWISGELECLSFQRHAWRSKVAVVGQPHQFAIPVMQRFLELGGELDVIGVTDQMDAEFLKLAAEQPLCRVWDVIDDVDAVVMPVETVHSDSTDNG